MGFATAVTSEEIGVPDPTIIEYPDGKPPSKLEVELGRTLFFDTRLSVNHQQSCASCHNPDLGFSDGMASGHGTMGGPLGRNTPHLYNLAWGSIFFWDGRSGSLEEQALGPIEAAGEMNMPLDSLLPRLKKVAYYRNSFANIYGKEGITRENLGKAIAAFERGIMCVNTAFDRYKNGEKHAMLPAAVRGMGLFQGKANCIACHSGANFTDESFHNIGLGDSDSGRARIVPGATMKGAFKTPGLRNIVFSAPYMHNGSEASLESVVRFYNRGGNGKQGTDKLIKPLNLSNMEIQELVAFMGALTDPVKVAVPKIPKDDDERMGVAFPTRGEAR